MLPLTPPEQTRIHAALAKLNLPAPYAESTLDDLIAAWLEFVQKALPDNPTEPEFIEAAWVRHWINEVKYQLGNASYDALNDAIIVADEIFSDHTEHSTKPIVEIPAGERWDVTSHWYFYRRLPTKQ